MASNTIKKGQLIFRYLFVILLIVISADNFLFSGNGGEQYGTIRLLFIASLPVFLFFKKRFPLKDNLLPIVFFVIALLFLSSLVNDRTISGGAFQVAVFIFGGLFITLWLSFDEFFDYYINIVFYGTIYSVLVWALAIHLHFLPMQETVTLGNAYAQSFGYCYFIHERNLAFFREPGMFQVYINLAFLMELIRKRGEINFSHIIVYAIGILSTYSTAGFICFFAIMIFYLLQKRSGSKKLFLTVLLIIGVAVVMTTAIYQEMVFSKFSSTDGESSMISRVAAIIVSLSISLHSFPNFLFGVGISGIRDLFPSFSRDIFGVPLNIDGNSTNTFFIPAAIFGTWILLFYFSGFYLLSKKIVKPWSGKTLLVMFILLLLFSNEGMYYSIIPYILVMYGLNMKNGTNTSNIK